MLVPGVTAAPDAVNTFGHKGLGFRVWKFRVWGLGFRVQGLGFRVQGSGFRVQGLGLKV